MKRKRLTWWSSCIGTALAVVAILAVRSLAAVDDPVAQCSKEIAEVRRAMDERQRALRADPEIAVFEQEVKERTAKVRAKDKEVADLTNATVNQDPQFIKLKAIANEAGKVSMEIKKLRDEAEKDPQVVVLFREVADLKAQAKKKEEEAKKLIDAKLAADGKTAALLAKKETVDKASKELNEFRKGAGQDPKMQALQAERDQLRSGLTAATGKLRDLLASKMESDAPAVKLNARLQELNAKMAKLRGTGAKGPRAGTAGAGAPGEGSMASDTEMASRGADSGMAESPEPRAAEMGAAGEQPPEQGSRGLPGKLAGARSDVELKSLVSTYEKSKMDVEVAATRITKILSALPREGALYQKTKATLATIGIPRVNPEMFQ